LLPGDALPLKGNVSADFIFARQGTDQASSA